MSATPSAGDSELWAELVKRHWAFIHARMGILRLSSAVELVRAGLHDGGGRVTALAMVPYLKEDERRALLPDLVAVASYGHGQTGEAIARILELPRDWVLANIEAQVEPLLAKGSYEEYRALMELYDQLGAFALERQVAERAAASEDPDIREAGEDFLEGLATRA
ncbi:MAG: hypothetical protein ABI193_01390 [Minicystis sp.]